MSHLVWRIAVAVSAPVLWLLANAAPADEPPQLKTEVEQLFDAGWKVGQRHLDQAARHFEVASSIAPADDRARYAWILVLVKHRRYERALEELNRILGEQPQHLTALKWRIRIKMLRKDYESALVVRFLIEEFGTVYDLMVRHETDMRTAAYVHALNRIGAAIAFDRSLKCRHCRFGGVDFSHVDRNFFDVVVFHVHSSAVFVGPLRSMASEVEL